MTVRSQHLGSAQKLVKLSGGPAIMAYILFALCMISIGLGLWLVGGYFTLYALQPFTGWTPKFTLHILWAIPVAVSVIEVALILFRDQLPTPALIAGGIITALDFASTVYGITTWIGGKEIFLFTGHTVPTLYNEAGQLQQEPTVIGIVGSLGLTFGPEQLVISGAGMLVSVAHGLRGAK
jgi:hypothetical protein